MEDIFKKYCTIVHNKKNNQINLSLKKKLMEQDGIDLDDVLKMKIKSGFLKQ